MSRMRNNRPSGNSIIKGSRMMGSSYGLGRDPKNYPARSPIKPNPLKTPEKVKGSTKHVYSSKKNIDFDPR
jgi:hypothetical protein